MFLLIFLISSLYKTYALIDQFIFTVPPPVMRCGIVPTLTIMKCSLKGLLLSQLQFQDSSCNLQDFATDLGDAYEIIINPAKCGATVVS